VLLRFNWPKESSGRDLISSAVARGRSLLAIATMCHLSSAFVRIDPVTINNPKGWSPRGCWCRREDSNFHPD
jgi:hypothetical protein